VLFEIKERGKSARLRGSAGIRMGADETKLVGWIDRQTAQAACWAQMRVLVGAVVAVAIVAAGLWLWAGPGGPVDFGYQSSSRVVPPAVAGEPAVLSVRGSRLVKLTLNQLRALPRVSYRAYQPQLKREFTYTGVPLRDLAELAGLSGQDLRVTASDNFGFTLRARDYMNYPMMVAYLADSQPLSTELKGPLLVTLPNLTHKQHFSDAAASYGSQWVWYVTRIVAAPPEAAGRP
jgi:hypothetical protein